MNVDEEKANYFINKINNFQVNKQRKDFIINEKKL